MRLLLTLALVGAGACDNFVEKDEFPDDDPVVCPAEGARACLTPTRVQVCGEGVWRAADDCAAIGRHCAEGECIELPECDTEGATLCLDDWSMRCAGQDWQLATDCAADGRVCREGLCETVGGGEEGDEAGEGEGEPPPTPGEGEPAVGEGEGEPLLGEGEGEPAPGEGEGEGEGE